MAASPQIGRRLSASSSSQAAAATFLSAAARFGYESSLRRLSAASAAVPKRSRKSHVEASKAHNRQTAKAALKLAENRKSERRETAVPRSSSRLNGAPPLLSKSRSEQQATASASDDERRRRHAQASKSDVDGRHESDEAQTFDSRARRPTARNTRGARLFVSHRAKTSVGGYESILERRESRRRPPHRRHQQTTAAAAAVAFAKRRSLFFFCLSCCSTLVFVAATVPKNRSHFHIATIRLQRSTRLFVCHLHSQNLEKRCLMCASNSPLAAGGCIRRRFERRL